MGTTEVKARLKVEDGGSSSVLDRIKKGFLGAGQAADDARDHAASFAEQIAAVAIGEKLSELTDKMIEFGKSFAEAAIEGEGADQALAGLIATAQGAKWSAAIESAKSLGDELDEIAVKAGQAGSDVGAAFSTLVEIAGATEAGLAKAKTETVALTSIANVLGKSAAGLAKEYAFMGEGAVEMKGQLFQLLQPTGIFGDKVKESAQYWAKLTDQSRTELLAYGLERVAATLGDAGPTFSDLMTTISNLWDMVKEKLGEPIINELRPLLTDLIGNLKKAMPQIEKFGVMLGREVGDWVEAATKQIEEGFDFLITHQEEIKNAIAEGYRTAKEVVMWILEHKEELAIAFGAKTAMPLLQGGASAAGKLLDVGAKGIGPLAGTGGGMAAGAATFGAFVAAVASFSLAVDQFGELYASTGGLKSDAQMSFESMQKSFMDRTRSPTAAALDSDEIASFEKQRAAFVKLAEEVGENARAAGELADRAWAAHKAVRDMVSPVEEAQRMFDNFAKARSAGVIPDEASIATADALIGQVGASFTKAMATQNQGAAQYIANLLGKSEALQGAFLASANLTSEGFEALASMVESQSKEFAELLRGRAAEGKQGAATPAAPKVVMTGGQTFNVKQDFRDQDPDRVAIMFEKGIGQAIERKITAGASIFGA